MALINSGDRAAARDYVDRSYADSLALSASVQEHLDGLFLEHTQTGRLRVERVSERSPHTADVLAENQLTREWLAIRLQVEPRPPHRISSLRFGAQDAPPGRGAPHPRTDAERARVLDEHLRRLAEAGIFSGVVLLARDGETVFAGAYGHADRETRRPNTMETAFNLASVTKLITAVAVAQLVEAGKLSFDDPLATYLPDFPNPQDAREIRIKHLLSHTSGLRNFMSPEYAGSRAVTVDEMLRFAREGEVAFAPGTDWLYSNTGFLALGKVIEEASGQSYFEYVREHIFHPAGMRSTGAPTLDALPPTAAIGYHPDGRGGYASNREALPFRGGPAGRMYSTAGDLLRFTEALRSGKLVSPAMVRVLTSPKPELAAPRYGYGFVVGPERGVAGHSGGFVGVTTNVDIFLDHGYTAILLSNYAVPLKPVVRRMRELVLRPVDHAP